MPNKRLFILMILIAPLFAMAQKKNFTYNQLFAGAYPPVLKPLPQIDGWVDDEHYIQVTYNEDGKPSFNSVEVLTGKSTPYEQNEPQEPQIEGARNITLSPDNKYVAYTKTDNNLYVKELATNKETPITNDGSDSILNGYASWIYYEEILGRPSKYKAFWWSPDSKHLAFMRFDESGVPLFPIYFANGQHGYLEQERYPKAGDKNPEVKVGIAAIGSSSVSWADFDPKADQYFGIPVWSPSSGLFLPWLNRGQDTMVVYAINAADAAKKEVYREIQRTWIKLDNPDRFQFLPGKEGYLTISDKDGWDNVYLYDYNGRMISQITKGNFWNTEIIKIDARNKVIYLRARKENSARFDIYKASLNGKSVTRMSFGEYSHDQVSVSPTGKYIITMYSNLQTPPAMAVIGSNGKKLRDIMNSKGAAFDEYFIPASRMFKVKSADGKYDLPLTVTYPANFDSTKKYPVWISVYGGPDAGTVFDRWRPVGGSGQLFAQEGVIQVTMDNRASGHFGKKGLDEIFRQLGKHEIEDYMDCGRWLRAQKWVDSSKIGITGGSFGGYITCMALTYGADVFTHGIALYSVTDWQLYDSHYTERFMETPKENAEGYRITSPITYADKYRGMLRIVHGSTDDNVHMQNSIQFIDKLEDLNKHFEFMIYPNQRHGIGKTKALHNLNETIRFVERYLLNK